ncbi:MAG: hypothetical protein ABI300_08270 [Rhodanobacter sp.]
MDELLARALKGVDPDAPGAFWLIFSNLMGLVPWGTLLWWNVAFVVVGALLGRWRGRWQDGAMWALVLGPIGWVVTLWRTRQRSGLPPPLPRRPGRSA